MEIYLIVVAIVIILGLAMPQHGVEKKTYIIVMAVVHAFVCGFRYMYLTGDLRKYAWDYYCMVNYSWTSQDVLHEGRNSGFFLLMKLFSTITNGDFQIFLIFLAIVTEVLIAILIFKYSPIPWFSYLVWNCMGFYVFGFSCIKQALAMAILLIAFTFIVEEKPVKFVITTLIAGLIHMPALVFLPAYWIAKRKVNGITISSYLVVGILFFFLRGPIVSFISSIYYEDEQFVMNSGGLGGRFIMIVAILVCSVLFKGFQEKNVAILFNIVAVAAIFQMLSGFDNIFTRMTDYYLQFSILFLPMIFSDYKCNTLVNTSQQGPVIALDQKTQNIALAVVAIVLIWFYYTYNIGVTIEYSVDNYTNFRFMWDVT
ncbi:MAG: EpsG family protein [Ruminococcus sp.]|nr:EpsG family protein [Ruminococcus sp.]